MQARQLSVLDRSTFGDQEVSKQRAPSCAGMIKVVGIVVLSAVFLGESSIFTTRQVCVAWLIALQPHSQRL